MQFAEVLRPLGAISGGLSYFQPLKLCAPTSLSASSTIPECNRVALSVELALAGGPRHAVAAAVAEEDAAEVG